MTTTQTLAEMLATFTDTMLNDVAPRGNRGSFVARRDATGELIERTEAEKAFVAAVRAEQRRRAGR